MATVEVKRLSYFNFSELFEFTTGEVFFDTPEIPSIPFHQDDTYITVNDLNVGRLDLISFDVYQTEELWWAIAAANDINLIPTDIKINRQLRIPRKQTIIDLLGKK